ncbi:MAG: ATPase domain-containing protein [Ignisphaera sp.]
MGSIVFGIDVLDKYFRSALEPPATVVVAGHPGAGKTTLASTICYANALRGYRCLYVSFQEDKDKFFRNMAGVGIDLRLAEEKRLFTFTRFPIVLDAEKVVEHINNLVIGFSPTIVVIDPINAMLLSVSDESKRAWLQNYFYELARQINGLVVLVAELPFGVEQLGLGSLEFVADAVVILKHRIEDGKLVRIMEFRKMRGSPLTLAELPFAIIPGAGLKIYAPIVLEELPAEGEAVKNPCRLLDSTIGVVRRGHIILFLYPLHARPPDLFLLIHGYMLANNAKALLVSFRASPKTIRDTIINSITLFGIEAEHAKRFIDENMVLKSFNPYSLSSSELLAQLIELVEHTKPDMVVLHALDILAISLGSKCFQVMYNLLNYLKSKHILTIITSADINSDIRTTFMRLSDVIIRFRYSLVNGISKRVFIWRREKDPFIATEMELRSCRDELARLVK